MKIYLDDRRTPSEEGWTIIRSYHDFIFHVNQSFDTIKLISLDYHLNDSISPEKTGLDCAKFLIEYCKKNNKHLPRVIVHDRSISGVQEIIQLVNNYLFYNEKIPNCAWHYTENS